MDHALLTQILTTVVVVAFSAALQRVSGFGFSLISTPLLAFAMPVQQAVVVLSIISLPSLVANWRELREHADLVQVKRTVLWAIPAMPFGLLLHHFVSDKTMRLVLAIAVFLAALVLVRGWVIPAHRHRRADAIAGLMSGLLNTSTGTNGPPLVVSFASQGMSPDRMRASLNGVFCASAMVSLLLFLADGLFTQRVLILAALGIPLQLVGRRVGVRLSGELSPEGFKKLMYTLLFGTSISSGLRVFL